MKNVNWIVGIGLSFLFLVGCGQSETTSTSNISGNQELSKVYDTSSTLPSQKFLFDAQNLSVTPIAPSASTQAVYRSGSGYIMTSSSVTDTHASGIYNIKYKLKNRTGQKIILDNDALAVVTSFQSLNGSSANVAGGGVVNADGYTGYNYYPYIILGSNKEEASIIAPDAEFEFMIALQLPQGASRATYSFTIIAGQEFDTVPQIASQASVLPLIGNSISLDKNMVTKGKENEVKLTSVLSLTYCVDTLFILDSRGIWSYKDHIVENILPAREKDSNDTIYGKNNFITSSTISCYDDTSDRLLITNNIISNPDLFPYTNRVSVYDIKANKIIPFAGSGQVGSTDAKSVDATFNAPRSSFRYGNSYYVADTGNAAIRYIGYDYLLEDQLVNTSMKIDNSGGIVGPFFIALDYARNLYYTTSNGVWARSNEGSIFNIYQTDNISEIAWHKSNTLLAVKNYQLLSITPDLKNKKVSFQQLTPYNNNGENHFTISPKGVIYLAVGPIIYRVDLIR